MPLWSRRRATPTNVLTASGVRITSSARQRADGNTQTAATTQRNIRALVGSRQPWQADAWGYRDMIPEVRFGTEFLAHAVASAGWSVAQVNNAVATDSGDTAEPIPFDSKDCDLTAKEKREAAEELARLPLESGSPFTERLLTNLATPGECYLHSYEGHTGIEEWSVRSLDELTFAQVHDGIPKMTLHEGLGLAREIDPDNEDVLRLWKPHAAKAWLADSAMRPLLDVCESVVLADREQRAASRSRIASNGLLLIPRGMTLQRTRRDENGREVTEEVDASSSRFVQTLTEAFINPISNEGDAGAVMPVMLVGDPDDLEKLKHLTFVRETSAEVASKVQRGLQRIATGLDIPAEVVTGMADANHWSAWMIDAATAKYHVGPWCRIVADCLTGGFLRPALIDRGWKPERAAMVQTWYDLGPVTENPNRRDDAQAAWDRGLISDATARRDLGYSEPDAPDDDEVFRRIAIKTGLQAAEVPELLRSLMKLSSGVNKVIDSSAEDTPPAPPAGQLPPGGQGRPAGQPPGGPGGGRSGPNARAGGTPNDGTPADRSRAPEGTAAEVEVLVGLSDRPVRPQKCKHCPAPATSSIIWAEGRAYVPHCPKHRGTAVEAIGGEDEVDAERKIRAAAVAGHSEVMSPRAGDPTFGTERDGAGPRVALTPEDSPTAGWAIDEDRCRRLPRIEMALVDRVLAAADPVIERAVERAANRARSQVRAVRGEPATDRLRAALGVDDRDNLADIPAADLLPRLGRDAALSLGLDLQSLMRDAWAPLEERYKQWVAEAVDDEVRAALQVLDPSPNAWVPLATPARVRPTKKATNAGERRTARKAKAAREGLRRADRMKGRVADSWGVLQDRLNAAADRQLYREDRLDVPTDGERSRTALSPGDVRDALDVVGGAEPGADTGLASAPDLVDLIHAQGARDAGREWIYGLTPRETFHPHLELDGTRFRDWSDGALSTALQPPGIQAFIGPSFRPGDHKGCLCRSASLYAVLADPDEFTDPDAMRAREIDDALRKLYGIGDGS